LSIRPVAKTGRTEEGVSRQDIIVVGASAGGVEALQVLAAGLPADLKAAVCIVLHIGERQSQLPNILEGAGPLPASHALNGEDIRPGRIYVAPPDQHLVLAPGRLHLVRGPKENRTRPAINPLFRSAAEAYGTRVTGVILTGLLDDGVAGLAEIKRRGGVAVVENPATAKFPSMPFHAMQHVEADYIVSLHDIANIVGTLAVTERRATKIDEPMERTKSELTCPECRGPLWEERQGKVVEYRCRVGHVYSPLAMESEYQDTVERSLWSTVVALEEAADIAEKLGSRLGPSSAQQAGKHRTRATLIREMLSKGADRQSAR
jgi:two-component system, chemotaxis family, protein-glutamate methylesterase/glutaminase